MTDATEDYSVLGYDDLLNYIRILERRIKELEAERSELRRKLRNYEAQIERLMSPPLIEAVVLSVLPDGRVVVKSSTGPNLVVTVAEGVDRSRIVPGAYVALNQRASTIVEVLPDREDPSTARPAAARHS